MPEVCDGLSAGPPALLRAAAGDAASEQTLLQLSGDLLTCGQLLVLGGSTDMILLPRQAALTGADKLFFKLGEALLTTKPLSFRIFSLCVQTECHSSCS